jgi:hypothetical protein
VTTVLDEWRGARSVPAARMRRIGQSRCCPLCRPGLRHLHPDDQVTRGRGMETSPDMTMTVLDLAPGIADPGQVDDAVRLGFGGARAGGLIRTTTRSCPRSLPWPRSSTFCRWPRRTMQIEEQDRRELVCAVMSTWWWAPALRVAC